MGRIEIGPEGSPNYVIDEDGSGNLELRDSDGNVIIQFAQDESISDVSSFSTGQGNITTLNVGSHEDIGGIEFGRESRSGPADSSNDDFSDQSNVTTSVSFASAFGSTPAIPTSNEALDGLQTRTFNESTTGFTLQWVNYGSTDRSGNTVDAAWVAIG